MEETTRQTREETGETGLRRWFGGFEELGIFAALVVICICLNLLNPKFFTLPNIINVASFR